MVLNRRSAQLALQATLLLAVEPEGSSRRLRDLARELGVAPTYLTKIVQGLTRVGLLRTVRGPGGGVRLARSAREIHPWDVLSAVEPVGEFEQCFLRRTPCSEEHPCQLHEIWAPARSRILDRLRTMSLLEFATEARSEAVLHPDRAQSTGSSFQEEKRRVVSDEG